MSATGQVKRVSVPEIAARKGKEPVSMLTAYTVSVARLLDPHVDCLLVGDSLGMVLYGMDSTLPVTVDMMIAHGAAVVRGSSHACVVVDMPWASYQESPQQAFRNAARILAETGCQAVKLEGGEEMADTVDFLVRRGIPVVGHVGLTPQAVNALGGYKARGRSEAEQQKILGDARAISEAGAFAIVVEGVVEPLGRLVTEQVGAVTIGIGASAACDGQVLVSDDMLGLFGGFTPKFVKRYADIGPLVAEAAKAYTDDVRARRFPGPEHVFGVKKPT
ncbi:3-methyl-2-oxobutanoate hydroxymethyltransferase [Aerophototrophica crusticola]|uniref:3-methyl-2-oxobutanoate hydroxymethyltransferase n=1 Tax=Aerophototrophica crusticola TaxID=1709002 RepID=A0A858R971_9PROT|nr:3-methyl-2-oxobutanoate hydroxymethyltransferase [Rhodospirillaceae bacterium B3]